MLKLLFAVSLLLHHNIAFAKDYSDTQIVKAIWHAEGGKRAKKAFGILSVKCNGYEECRQVCLNTVRNNRKRFKKQKKYRDFLSFLASRYAPVNSDTDNGTNRFWLKNLKYFLEKGG